MQKNKRDIGNNHTGVPLRRTLLSLTLAAALTACGGGGQALVDGGGTTGEFTISTHELASRAKAARTPGTAGITVAAGSKLATQFGAAGPDLNRVRYTRYGLAANAGKPVDAVLVAMPGTLAASHSYLILAENLVRRMWADHQAVVEVWGWTAGPWRCRTWRVCRLPSANAMRRWA